MRRLNTSIFAITLPLLVVLATLKTHADPVAEELIARSGLTGGVMAVPRASNQKLLLDLAAQPRWVVYTQADKSDAVLTLRKQAVDAGVLASSLYVGHGAPDQLGLADRSAALLLVTDLTTADLTDANRGEWLRVLAPRRGVAIVGNSDAKRLSADALKKWAANLSNAKISEEDGGRWVTFGRTAPEGADEWPMRYHDPANQRVSDDETLQPPFLPQWYALPVHQAYWGSTLVCSGGRSYLIWAYRNHRQPVSLIAADLASGMKLWEHKFSWDKPRNQFNAGYYPGRSCLIARDDVLYLVDEDEIAVLDGETGQERNRIAGPQEGGQIKWLTQAEGLFAVLAGEADAYQWSSLQSYATNSHGRCLAVYDKRWKKLWGDVESGDIDEREIAIHGGRIFYHVADVRVACRDLRTGKLVWENRDPEVLKLLGARLTGKQKAALLPSLPALRAQDEALVFRSKLLSNFVVLDPGTGRLLWEKVPPKHWGRASRGFPLDGKWYGTDVYDLRTGDVVDESGVPADGCGPSMAVADMFVTSFGKVSRIGGPLLRNSDLKPACDVGLVVADGVALSPPPLCRCNMMAQGGRAFTSAGGLAPHTSGNKATRFVRGPAFGRTVPNTVKATAADWPTYRHDTARSGATPVSLPAKQPTVLWKWTQPKEASAPVLPALGWLALYTDATEWVPTQVVSVGDRAFFAGGDGVVRCLDVTSGEMQWQYPVGSRVLAPPAVEGGHVLVGAADGWLYCLQVTDGSLVWRFRLAPAERRIMWYGHLASTWPVTGGAVVRGGVVYAVAGFQRGNGVHAVALNAGDGRVLWESHDAGKTLGGASNFGHLALDDSRLWFCAATSGPGAFDLKTGEPELMGGVRFASTVRRGLDIATLGGGRVLFGGRRLIYGFEQWLKGEKAIGYTLYNADTPLEKGKRVCIGADVAAGSLFAPLFDDEIIVMGKDFTARVRRSGEIAAYTRADLLARVDKGGDPLRNLLAKNAPWYFTTLVSGKQKSLPDEPLWGPLKMDAFTGLLTPNAVLLACIKDWKGAEKPGEWFLAAVSREDGRTLWTVPLPGRPAWNGLSMTRDGRILISLWTGSVICMGAGD